MVIVILIFTLHFIEKRYGMINIKAKYISPIRVNHGEGPLYGCFSKYHMHIVRVAFQIFLINRVGQGIVEFRHSDDTDVFEAFFG